MQNTIQYIKSSLSGLYPEPEIEGLTRLIVEAVCGWDFTAQLIRKSAIIGAAETEKIKAIVERLKQFEPIQYIIGETIFSGLPIKVSTAVLIPRPETEELVNLIVSENRKNGNNILDIGTGSGCIALALKNRLPFATVSGVDVSETALEIARSNSKINQLEVVFYQADILNWQNTRWSVFNVIVSNPPYVTESEKVLMHKNVLNYEPATALFVSDSDPLLFYRAIANFAKEKLKPQGRLYFEINEKFGEETKNLLESLKFSEVRIIADIHGKSRFVAAKFPGN